MQAAEISYAQQLGKELHTHLQTKQQLKENY